VDDAYSHFIYARLYEGREGGGFMKDIDKIKKYELDGMGKRFISPVEKRVKKSKFAKLLTEMNDAELKALAFCMFGSQKVKEALFCMKQAVENGVQIYAMEQELKRRMGKK
jgi:predicted peroxiredoxin